MKKFRVISVLVLALALVLAFAGCGKEADNSTGDGKVPDIFGNDTPTGGNDTPAGGNDTPTGGNDTPTGGNDTPTGGNDTPAGGNDTPAGGNDTPAGGNDTPEVPVQPEYCTVHTYEEAERKDSTCTSDGEVKYVCKVCQAVKYERLYANHKVENNKCTLCNLEAAINLEFTLSADGKSFEVTGSGSYDSSDVIVPSHVAGLPVVKVSGLKPVKKVYLPDTVTAIGDGAFKGTNLESIYIPDSVTEIGASAFEECKKLARIKLPESVAFIGASAFGYCSNLIDIAIPDAVTELSDGVLYNCAIGLESLGDLSRITYFGSRFWHPDSQLDVFVVPEGATLGAYAFDSWKINEIILPSTLTEIPEGLFKNSKIERITIPNGVKTVGKEAFSHCNKLASITLPEGVTVIDEGAFYLCSSLTDINLPDSVEIIGANAFKKCSKLELTALPAALKEIGIDAFTEAGIKNLTLPEGLESIGMWAFCRSQLETVVFNGADNCGSGIFYECEKLTNVTIGANVKEIPESAFSRTNLFFITIPASVEKIGLSAFEDCSNLQRVTFEEGVQVIDTYAFYGCGNLKSIVLPESIRTLGEAAFRDSGLEKITLPAGLENVGTGLFYDCDNLTHIYCAAEKPLFDPESLRVYERGNRIESAFWGEIVLGSTGK